MKWNFEIRDSKGNNKKTELKAGDIIAFEKNPKNDSEFLVVFFRPSEGGSHLTISGDDKFPLQTYNCLTLMTVISAVADLGYQKVKVDDYPAFYLTFEFINAIGNNQIKYYPNVIGFISARLEKKFPKLKPRKNQKNIPAYLLWMMQEIQKFDNSVKAGRWIGWIMAHAEMLGIMTNKQSRKLARMDCQQGFI